MKWDFFKDFLFLAFFFFLKKKKKNYTIKQMI